MKEQGKIVSFVVTGHGETVLQPSPELHVNKWLAHTEGRRCCCAWLTRKVSAGAAVTMLPCACGLFRKRRQRRLRA